MKTTIDRYRVTLLSAAALASVVLLAGCSHSQDAAPSGGAGAAGGPGAAAQVGAPPTPDAIQSNASKIQSDSSLTPAQKQIMMNENQHALQKATAGGGH